MKMVAQWIPPLPAPALGMWQVERQHTEAIKGWGHMKAHEWGCIKEERGAAKGSEVTALDCLRVAWAILCL